jgi:hypothetical protein
LAVFYACDARQVAHIAALLHASPEVASHPLLMVGVFAELQLNRMRLLERTVVQMCDLNNRQSELNWACKQAFLIKDLSNRLRQGILKAREAEEEMRAARAQLKEMADRIDDQKKRWEERNPPGTAWVSKAAADSDRFKGRFKEIDIELDGLMAQCRIAAEQQSYAGALVSYEFTVVVWESI